MFGLLYATRIVAPELSAAERVEAGRAKLISFSICEDRTTS